MFVRLDNETRSERLYRLREIVLGALGLLLTALLIGLYCAALFIA